MIRHLAVLICLAVVATGCGSSGGPAKGSGNNGGGGGGPVSQPIVVAVNAGQTSSGVNITVFNPASATPPNAELLGVGTNGTVFLQNTGDIISRSTSQHTVFICGPGLSGSMIASIAGAASDFTIGPVSSTSPCTPTAGGGANLPGIMFSVTVNPAAPLGPRTVILQNQPNNDITTFTGGLEIVQ